MNNIDSYATNEALFGSTFAEAEGFLLPNAVTEGAGGGWVYQNQQAVQGSAHPVPLALYEMNLGVMGGSISQAALDGYASSMGGGLAVVDAMLQQMRAGILNQALFALTQFQYGRAKGSASMLWGAVVDMGGATNRVRPQYLALELANRAISNGATMLQTVHSGADPTWNQALVNQVQLKNAHYLESFAFQSGSRLSLIVFNLERSAALPVTFSGVNAPEGAAQIEQLTSAHITDTNENSKQVTITSSSVHLIPGMILSLPPFSMTLLTWRKHASSEAAASAKRQ
ncbi:MAG: hypothetical protein JO336_01785, partial [Acidobacteriia bacterium]|nr:hypothetical protein [Terriglobia bacterium]